MIRWYPNLYLDSKAKKNIVKITDRLERGKYMPSLYCICKASNPDNLFDIYNANELLFKHYKRMGVDIIGLAYSKEAAIELIEQIAHDVYENTENFNVREYFRFTESIDQNDRV